MVLLLQETPIWGKNSPVLEERSLQCSAGHYWGAAEAFFPLA